MLASVILNVVKDLALYAGVTLYLNDTAGPWKGETWVLEDELLHCVQHDKGGDGPDIVFWHSRLREVALE